MYVLETTLITGLVYAFVSYGLVISFKVLHIADLTTDASFVFGMAVSVVCSKHGYPLCGMIAGMLCGSLAGFVTARFITEYKISPILAGIITATGLYTINLMTMGFLPNVSLLKEETVFSKFSTMVSIQQSDLVFLIGITLVVFVLLKNFFETTIGLAIKATGDNIEMVKSCTMNPDRMIVLGLMLSNGLCGLSGGLVGQLQRCCDINAGIGIVVVGLAGLVIGESLIHKDGVGSALLSALCGNLIYRFIYALILTTGIVPMEMLKLVTAMIVGFSMCYPTIKEKKKLRFKERKDREYYVEA